MSDDTDTDHTHRVVGKAHKRSNETDDGPGSYATYEVGDLITPTEGELSASPDRFERLDDADEQAESGDVSESSADTPETADETEGGDEDAQVDESDGLTAEAVEGADYSDLRSMAAGYDEVNGNWGEDRLRAELLDRVSED